jgi:serine/threonine protein phosphatase 1
MKTYVISDIHGCWIEFVKLLKTVNFNYQKNKLICLGDVCDRGLNPVRVFNELFKIKNLIYIIGNHDQWFLEYETTKMSDETFRNWQVQGGKETLQDFKKIFDKTPYINFLKAAKLYYIDNRNRIFVHGGFDENQPIETQNRKTLIWDRTLVENAKWYAYHYPDKILSQYKEIFVGHTPTILLDQVTIPLHYLNVWAIDTGKIYNGKLTLMDVETKQYWQE